MTPGTDLPVPRRVLLAVGLGGLSALAACDLVESAPSPSPTPGGGEPELRGDEGLALRVAGSLAESAALGTATGARFGRLRDLTGQFVELHESHGRLLGGLPPVAPPKVRNRRGKARKAFLAAEADLQSTLVAAATEAESGALAQALAAMAAGVAQLRAVS